MDVEIGLINVNENKEKDTNKIDNLIDDMKNLDLNKNK